MTKEKIKYSQLLEVISAIKNVGSAKIIYIRRL
jgi:hypothetical protein